MGKKKTKTKSTETIAPSAYAQPYIDSAAQTLKPAYEESLATSRQFQPGLLAASNFYGDTLAGKYLDGNPHLQGVIDSSNRDITDAVNSNFMGRFGSGYHTNALVRGLGENENRLRYGDYAQERAYQNDAGRNIAGIATTATALPMLPAQGYADGIAGLLGRYLTSTGQSKTTQSSGLLGSLAKAAQIAATVGSMSDRRLKTDVVKLGEESDGLGVYRYRYITDQPGARRVGVMADEVSRLRPWALGAEVNGFQSVHYGEL